MRGGSSAYLGEQHPKLRKYRDLVREKCLAHLRHSKEACVAHAEWMKGIVGADTREVTGLHSLSIAA